MLLTNDIGYLQPGFQNLVQLVVFYMYIFIEKIHVRELAEQDARAGGHHDGLWREEEREGVERLGAGPWRVAHTDPQHGSTLLTNT